MIDKATIISWLHSLAQSQGFYGRMLRDFMNLTEESQNDFVEYVNSHNVVDCLDFILLIEQ